MAKPKTKWTRTGSGWTAEASGWGLHVWYDDEPLIGEPRWEWSAMRFANPDDELDDRIVSMGGSELTKEKAMRAAVRAANKS